MAEHPAASPGRAPDSELDVLLATKVYVPSPQPGFVYRPRLVQVLDEGLSRRLMLVCAPAGFGKTALLADWVQRSRRPVTWLSLDASDNDPARFWRHAFAALDLAEPGIGARVAPLLSLSEPPQSEVLVTALINELAQRREPGQVETPWGPVAGMISWIEDSPSFSPEFESCRRLADEQGLPLKTVYEAAQQAWAERTGR